MSWTVADTDSTVSSQTGCGATTITTNTPGTTLTCSATSLGGTASRSVTITRDATPPLVTCASADGLWHAADVSLGCTASDAVSELVNAADASFTLSTTVPPGTETASAATGSKNVADRAGNVTTAGPIGGNKVDKKAPSISLLAPASTSYQLGQVVDASYTCADGGSGLAACAGPVANGANIDTASVGTKTFTVNAADTVGNAGSASVAYTVIAVVYDFSGFFQPVDNLPTLNAVKAGSAIPVTFALGGNQGLSIFAAGYPTSQPIACDGGALVDDVEQTVTAGSSSLSYDATTGQYTYVWKTDKAWAATCRQLNVRLADGTDHRANFKFK